MATSKGKSTLFIYLFIILHNGQRSDVVGLLNGYDFGNTLESIADKGLGVDTVQGYYSSLSYSNNVVDGQRLSRQISSSLTSKFQGVIDILGRLKNTVEQEVDSFQRYTSIVPCCEAANTQYNERFQGTVNTNEACAATSGYAPDNRVYPSQNIVNIMKENYGNNPDLKWQYLGTEDGILLNYPSFKTSTCTEYDPRFRPFYVSAATPVQKDVVIVIDRSGSMTGLHNGKSLLQIAKEAATTVLQTLNPNDRVGVVAFDTYSEVPGSNERSCVGGNLAEATPLNVKFFTKKIKGLSTGGYTNYEAALTSAFSFFENSSPSISNEKREQVILFLTDGERTKGGDPLDTIRDLNAKLNNRVIILTYGLGQSLGAKALKELQDMANQTMSNSSAGEIQKGIFTHVTDPSKLRSAMASYYNRFSSGEKIQDVIFSAPYYDIFGLGLIISLCLPVYKQNGNLYGVVCSDLTMSNLLTDVTYFRHGEASYAFIIDGRGRTMMHPLMPYPSSFTDDPIYVYIDHLERASDAREIIDSMVLGYTGNKTLTSIKTISRGDVLTEGIHTSAVLSSYYWIPVDKSNFSVCIVVASGDRYATLDTQPNNKNSFVYHRLDLETGNDYGKCKYFNRYATKETSVVMLSPAAFINPSNYLNTKETTSDITTYKDFLTGVTTRNPGIVGSVLGSVKASYRAESVWKSSTEADKMVVWRYIGTADGVMRMYPGIQLPKNYDHTRRPWYKKTLANRGKTVISSPYIDLWGSGYLLTLSKVITDTGTYEDTASTMAVMGTDFTIPYLYQLLLHTYAICNENTYRCFLLDSSGYIVLHPDFVEPDTSSIEIENVHITYKEPAIADDLINTNNMIKTDCIDFENIKQQFSYRITILDAGLDRISTNAKYEIKPIPNTNIFIVIKKNTYISNPPLCCNIYGKSPDQLLCTGSNCGCLCYTVADFNYCQNRYTLLRDAAQTCTPRVPPLETKSISDKVRISTLSNVCVDPQCSKKTTKGDCHSVVGCSWCIKDKYQDRLSSPYCVSQEYCYFGIEGRCSDGINENCYSPDKRTKEEESGGVVAAAVIIPIIIVVVIVTVIILKRRQSQGCHRGSRHQSNSNSASAYQGSNTNPVFTHNEPFYPSMPSAPPPSDLPTYDQAVQQL